MEHDFFELYERQQGLSIEVGHNSVADWVLVVKDRRAGKDAVFVQDCDRKKVFSEAYYRLAEYLSDTRGGY